MIASMAHSLMRDCVQMKKSSVIAWNCLKMKTKHEKNILYDFRIKIELAWIGVYLILWYLISVGAGSLTFTLYVKLPLTAKTPTHPWNLGSSILSVRVSETGYFIFCAVPLRRKKNRWFVINRLGELFLPLNLAGESAPISIFPSFFPQKCFCTKICSCKSSTG